MMSEIQMIPVTLIDLPKTALRDFQERATASLELLEQVKEDGNVSQSLLVRPRPGGRYELVDGLTRYSQLKKARKREAPCIIQDLTDEQAIVKAIQLNSTRRETDPIDYLRAFLELMKKNPSITVEDLANMVTKTVKWVQDILRLGALIPEARQLVKRGEITATNAHMLARIQATDQKDYLDDACAMGARQFRLKVSEVVNKYREDIRTLNLERYHSGVKPAHMRPMHEVKEELATWETGRMAILSQDLETPLEAWQAGVKWVMSLDPESLKKHQLKYLEREEERQALIKRLRERNHRFDK